MNYYLLFKSLHLIAVISWMAGLLYLPRIFVYHVENYQKKETTEIFETMERKLYYYIMRPAMLIAVIAIDADRVLKFMPLVYFRLRLFECFIIRSKA